MAAVSSDAAPPGVGGEGNGDGRGGDGAAPDTPVLPSLVIPSRATLLKVLHDFEARSPDEITLRKGETVELLERDEEFGDGWFTGRSLATQQLGLFPQVYTAPIPARVHAVHASPAITPSTRHPSPAVDPGSATTLRPQPPRPLSRTSSRSSHISVSSSHASGGPAAHTPPGPLSVEKVTSGPSGRSTPTQPARASENQPPPPPLVLVGNTVEERAANYVQGLHSPVVNDTLSDIEEAISEIHKNRESRATQVLHGYGQRHSIAMPSPVSGGSRGTLSVMSELQDSSSEYSVQVDQPGQTIVSDAESDELPIQGSHEADDVAYTTDEVRKWTPAAVAQYFRGRGIAPATCAKFEEQEVTGAILMQLEMAHLKELELGSFGKRFEVWKEIEHLVQRLRPTGGKPGSGSTRPSSVSFASGAGGRKRSSTVGSLPRIPSHQHDRMSRQQHRIDVAEANQYRSFADNPPTATTIASSIASPTFELFEAPRSPPSPGGPARSNSRRYTAQSAKRASVHEAASGANTPAMPSSGRVDNADGKGHSREGSFDREWSLAALGGSPPRPATASGMRDMNDPKQHKASASAGTGDSMLTGDSGFSGSQPQTPYKLTERSYFSSGESAPRERKVLQKKNAHGRHSRVPSAESPASGGSSRKLTPSLSLSAAHAYYKASKEKHKRKSASFSGSADLSADPDAPKLSPAPSTKGTGPQRRVTDEFLIGRAISPSAITSAPHSGGQRSISETLAATPTSPEMPTSARSIGSNEGSAASLTPTAEPEPISPVRPKNAARSASKRIRGVASGSGLRQKSKKQTTAWEKGLREITPAEAALQGDYSGWMKKRGSSGINTWKTRFFVLTGRRLAYFYTEADTKERGLIDITSHKVLRASEDKLIGLHAAFAAATSPAVSPNPGGSMHAFQNLDSPELLSPDKTTAPQLPDTAEEKSVEEKGKEGKEGKEDKGKKKDKGEKKDKSEKKEKADKHDKQDKDRGWFTFKLVPPAPGAAKGVTFTPPRLHYFATDTRDEGKRWMAAIMKATIDRDETKPVVTSYSAQTISLAKARMLRARPSELGQNGGGMGGLGIMGVEEADEGDADVEDEREEVPPALPPREKATSTDSGGNEGGGGGGGESAGGGSVVETDADGQLKKVDGHPELQMTAFNLVG